LQSDWLQILPVRSTLNALCSFFMIGETMKRLNMFVLTVIFILSFVVAAFPATPTHAADTENGTGLTAQVLASQLYIRGRPAITGGILARVNWGTRLTVLGRNPRATWIKVVAPDHTVGWVSVFWVRLSRNVRYDSLPIVAVK
jgi:hypothetical protein